VADLDPRLLPLSKQTFDLAGIDVVVNTHLHFDHCGGNHLFAGRPMLVRCRASAREIVALERELEARARTLAPRLLELPGCGPLSAAKLLSEIGPIERFANDARLARHAGVAPLEASSGKQRRHRLDPGATGS
jgi:transposase